MDCKGCGECFDVSAEFSIRYRGLCSEGKHKIDPDGTRCECCEFTLMVGPTA
jgi:hypothetical protein